jgi:glyoxylase-like metal-dependent hydrolase (beta-lactamase superfamily II)/rhodanese-related sulfurtransferase
MYIEQLYTNCLAEAAYYIESDGEAAIIDPLRETAPYLELAEKRKAKIKYIFETHFHADFVSGHIDLAAETGAEIVYGPGASAEYDIRVAEDGEDFQLGALKIRVLHTPGHTLESSCFLLLDQNGNPHSIFTGDTLFVGDVGRPDLAVKQDLTREQLAGMLYDSIEEKIKPLPSYVNVYPGHGPGSACGKVIGSETFSTIGEQMSTNYALKADSREQFINLVTEGLNEPPKYFFMDAAINRKGYRPISEVIEKNSQALSAAEFKDLMNDKTIVIDTRDAADFAVGYIPHAVNIGLNGNFAVTVGTIVDPDKELLLVSETGREEETVLRLARVGYENVKGYLKGGFSEWVRNGLPSETVNTITASDFADRFRYNSCMALDVRNPDEWVPGFVAGAKLLPLSKIWTEEQPVDADKTCFVYCAGGYRSMVAVSLLKKRGFKDLVNVIGGMRELKKTDIAIRQLTTA